MESKVRRDSAREWASLHLGGFGVWIASVITVAVLGGGRTVVADTPGEYVLLGVMAAGCAALVTGAVKARLTVGTIRAGWSTLPAIAAMVGVFVPAAVRTVRGRG